VGGNALPVAAGMSEGIPVRCNYDSMNRKVPRVTDSLNIIRGEPTPPHPCDVRHDNPGFNNDGITRVEWELNKHGYIGLPQEPGLGVEVDET
jgi:hypothetical protein